MKKVFAIVTFALAALSASAELHFGWVSKDVHHVPNVLPAEIHASPDTIHAWRGEKVSAEAALMSSDGLDGALTVEMEGGDARYMRYVVTDDQRSCGDHNFKLTPWLVADIIDIERTMTPEAGRLYPIWCSIAIPADAQPGERNLTLRVVDERGKTVAELPLVVKVSERVLPEPKDWAFHLDMWQQPYSVSRYYGLERWSDEHFEALKPYMRELASLGQKVVSTVLFYEPWGVQSEDKFDPMVETVRRLDGSWSFDYDIFDRYVAMMEECGISKQINCYSMVPWDMSFRYFDQLTGEYRTLDTPTGTEEYNDLWGAFLADFASHLRDRGWFDKTCIAMDERGLKSMMDAYDLVKRTIPDMKMALAGNRHEELVDKLHDYCIPYGHSFSAEELAARKAAGRVTTVYTCCTEAEPNILSNNNPSDAAWLPLYAISKGFDGYLHWSWINWNQTPLEDTRFRLFSAGDTYLFYPGPRSSIRHERLREGIQMAEKIRLLRESGVDMAEVDAALNASGLTSAAQVAAVRQAIEAISD